MSEQQRPSSSSFRVASFNILAKEFATEETHKHAPEQYRQWKYRRPIIRRMLLEVKAGRRVCVCVCVCVSVMCAVCMCVS